MNDQQQQPDILQAAYQFTCFLSMWYIMACPVQNMSWEHYVHIKCFENQLFKASKCTRNQICRWQSRWNYHLIIDDGLNKQLAFTPSHIKTTTTTKQTEIIIIKKSLNHRNKAKLNTKLLRNSKQEDRANVAVRKI